MSSAARLAAVTRKEARQFPVDSLEWDWRRRAAWKLLQLARGESIRDDETPPPHFMPRPDQRIAAE